MKAETSGRHSYDFALIGNCSYLSYIDQSANVIWQCWPRFDSSFVFGSLLDQQKGGHFYVRPAEKQYTSRQYYLENTNVLCTEFSSDSGQFKVIDFAPRFYLYERYFKPLMLMRKVVKISGNPKVQVGCSPRGEYGEATAEVTFGSNHVKYLGLEEQVRLHSNISLNFLVNETPFTLTETKYLCLSWGASLEAPLKTTLESFLEKTIDYWRHWVAHCNVPNIYQKEVIRSSLALKLHQYDDTGAIIASGTTSLPESPGSGRNWDYRFFWVRDCFYTLKAFEMLGQFEELERYSQFLQNLVSWNQNHWQPVYTILGDHDLDEKTLPLEGYLHNQPVRIGNAAYLQKQHDSYGQMILSLLPLYTDQRFIQQRRLVSTDMINGLLSSIEATMDQPDAGIWELRNKEQLHCHTFLFHWAGAKAAAKIGECMKDDDLVQKAKNLAQAASQQIERCFMEASQSYTSFVGSTHHDASLLQLITMQYLDPNSERASKHLKAIEQELLARNGLMYRYLHNDDFGQPEVTFLVCGFWYVSALAETGQTEKAIESFEHLLKCSNHLGLMSEDIAPNDLSQWGNFVQTYSHVGLINAAFDISKKLNRPNFL